MISPLRGWWIKSRRDGISIEIVKNRIKPRQGWHRFCWCSRCYPHQIEGIRLVIYSLLETSRFFGNIVARRDNEGANSLQLLNMYTRKDAGAAELARLESVCPSKGDRGFESHSFRHWERCRLIFMQMHACLNLFILQRLRIPTVLHHCRSFPKWSASLL